MINERYKIINKLGEGRSSVFLCNDLDVSNRELAIKILSKNAGTDELFTFLKEFIVLNRFDHPSIIKVSDLGTIVKKNNEAEIESGSRFFTLEFFNGSSLLNYKDLNNEEELKKIITQLCSVLYYLHQSNYIYYDLKPENILIKKVYGETRIKLIDFGFIQNVNDRVNETVRGTAEYIAPELLKNSPHDNRVDLYSLGIILYRIIYKKFPFETDDELSIYKAHINKEFEFGECSYSDQIIKITKKLLEKEPENRYGSALQVIYDLNEKIEKKLTINWAPAKIFTSRNDINNILNSYINDKESSEVFTVKGFEGSGKTAVAEELFFNYKDSILIKNDRTRSGIDFIMFLLKDILYKDFVFSKLDDETINQIEETIKKPGENLSDSLKAIFNKITRICNFILILDDFNLYDDFTLELMKELVPILQVNKIKLILTEVSDNNYKSGFIFNLREVNLTPFTDVNIDKLVELSFRSPFPKDELKKIILQYADLLPGNVDDFIKDTLQLDIIKYNRDGAVITINNELENLLKSSHDKIYEMRFSSLSEGGKKTAEILSLFNKNIDLNLLTALYGESKETVSKILEELNNNNIISTWEPAVQFTSGSLKKYIYSNIKNKKVKHLQAGKILKENFPDFDSNEIARQFELAAEYETTYEILNKEVKRASEVSAYSYQKNILKHLQELPLGDENKLKVEIELSRVLKTLNENKECLDITKNLLNKNIDNETKLELEIQEGVCLIGIGELNSGKILLEKILNKVADTPFEEEIKLEIAYAEFDLNNYEIAEEICYSIISKKISKKVRARAYNLIGLIEIYHRTDFDKAVSFFTSSLDIFSELNLLLQVSKMNVNIGNIYNIKGEYDKALEQWDKAMKLNNKIGDLQQEAKILINYGAYYYTKLIFDKAIENYKNALKVFNNYGDRNIQGIILSNLAEAYLPICEYQKCLDSLNESINIFNQIQNKEEKVEVLFLMAKLYFLLNTKKLEEVIEEYEAILSKISLAEKHENNIELLKQFYLILNNKKAEYDKLALIRDSFLEQEDKYHYARVNLLLADEFIKEKRYKEAFEALNLKDFIEITDSNILNSERNFLLALISRNNTDFNMPPALEMLEKINDEIKDERIIELTWKVLYELSNIYYSRGNLEKAAEHASYSKAVILHIAENIEDDNLRLSYLSNPYRKEAASKATFINSEK